MREEREKKVMLRMGEMTEAAQEAEEAGAGRVGFKEEDGRYFADMKHFFDGSCHSNK